MLKARYIWLLFIIQILVVAVLIFVMVPKLSVGLIQGACGDTCADKSAIQIAAEIGRLDVISLSLAFLGIGVGAFAIFSFFAVKEEAERVAKRSIDREFSEKYGALRTEISEQIEAKLAAAIVSSRTNVQNISTEGRIEESEDDDA